MIVIQKKQDGGVVIHTIHEHKFEKDVSKPFLKTVTMSGKESKFLVRDIKDAPALKNLSPDDYFFVDSNPKPKDLESRRQLYWENDSEGKPQVKIDKNWEKRIMPDHIIKQKFLKRKMATLRSELEIENPDIVSAMKLRIDLDDVKNRKASSFNEDSFWLEKAVEGLDERVAKGETDKPGIRAKIVEKITELKQKEQNVGSEK